MRNILFLALININCLLFYGCCPSQSESTKCICGPECPKVCNVDCKCVELSCHCKPCGK